MTLIDCPRCHGGNYQSGRGYIPPKNPKPTMRIENVMATTQMIHYRCNNCGYKEQRPYADEWDDTEPIKTEKQQTLF